MRESDGMLLITCVVTNYRNFIAVINPLSGAIVSEWTWATANGQDYIRDFAINAATGNIIAVGGTAVKSQGILYPQSQVSILSSTGSLLVVKQMSSGGRDTEVAKAVALHPQNGSIFVGGFTTGLLPQSQSLLINGGNSSDLYLASLDPVTLNIIWIKQFGSSANGDLLSSIVATNDTVYVCGSLSLPSSYRGFVNAFDLNGNLKWNYSLFPVDFGQSQQLTKLQIFDEYLYVSGHAKGQLSNVSMAAQSLFVIRFNSLNGSIDNTWQFISQSSVDQTSADFQIDPLTRNLLIYGNQLGTDLLLTVSRDGALVESASHFISADARGLVINNNQKNLVLTGQDVSGFYAVMDLPWQEIAYSSIIQPIATSSSTLPSTSKSTVNFLSSTSVDASYSSTLVGVTESSLGIIYNASSSTQSSSLPTLVTSKSSNLVTTTVLASSRTLVSPSSASITQNNVIFTYDTAVKDKLVTTSAATSNVIGGSAVNVNQSSLFLYALYASIPVLFLILLIGIILVRRRIRQKRAKRHQYPEQAVSTEFSEANGVSIVPSNYEVIALNESKYSKTGYTDLSGTTLFRTQGEISIPAYLKMQQIKDFKRGKLIAIGGGGMIYECQVISNELKQLSSNHNALIVKVMQNHQSPEMMTAFYQELSLLQYFKSCPQVAQVIAYTPTPPCILMKYYQAGSLADLISGTSVICGRVDQCLKAPNLWLKIIGDIARGLSFIHNLQVAHCDIKSANILLDVTENHSIQVSAVITDFGLSRIVDSQSLLVKEFKVSKVKGGSQSYASPEVFMILRSQKGDNIQSTNFGQSSSIASVLKASDTFAFAVVLNECLNHRLAWK
ncbi:hypothetical protein MIR68_010151 [Amoeboaphelidium protococcarum]|nr:hypothetical protein MIR68_010151 [Amoeboaphelidium protococcarum]